MRFLLSIPFLLSFLLSACGQLAVSTPEPVTLTVAGSTEMQPLLFELTSEYSRRNPSILFEIRGGGSTLAERWVAEGRIDLAASTIVPSGGLPVPETERIPIGLDAVAVLVHTTNPVEAVTLLQLKELFSGKILLWSELGGEESEILLVSREDGSGSRLLFEERVMSGESVALTAVVMPTSEDVVAYISGRPAAIGYASQAFTAVEGEDLAERNRAVRALRVEGSTAAMGIDNPGSYHLSRPLYLIRRRDDDPHLRSFIDFVLSPAGQSIVDRRYGRIR